jgi:hypothetical protein
MPYTPRDVIVYLTDYPWKLLVKNHNGVVTRTAVTDYSKASNYRNILAAGDFAWPLGNVFNPTEPSIIVPPTTPMPSTEAVNGGGLLPANNIVALSDPAAGIAPRPESFTRVIRYFCTTDAPTAPGTPYQCWDDEYRGLGDIDPTNELEN